MWTRLIHIFSLLRRTDSLWLVSALQDHVRNGVIRQIEVLAHRSVKLWVFTVDL